MRNTLIAVCLSFSTFTVAHAQGAASDCDVLITRGLREYSISSESSSYLNAVFSQHCHASGQRKESSSGFGLESIAKSLPIKFGGNSNDSSVIMTNFCKMYKESTAAQSQADHYREKIVEKAYDTYAQCRQLASLGFYVTHDLITGEKAQVLLRAGVGKPIEVNGVDTSSNVKCEGAIEGKPVRYIVGTNTKSENTIGMFCTREAREGPGGTKVYDEGSVAIDITGHKYNFFWPRSEILAEDVASVVKATMVQLRTQIENLAQWGDQKPGTLTKNTGSPGPFTSTCPDGYYAAGITQWGNTAKPYCLGCFVNMQLVCRKLNVQ